MVGKIVLSILNLLMLPVMLVAWFAGFTTGCIVRPFMKGFIS